MKLIIKGRLIENEIISTCSAYKAGAQQVRNLLCIVFPKPGLHSRTWGCTSVLALGSTGLEQCGDTAARLCVQGRYKNQMVPLT